jgi:hypothetical protein
LIIPDPYDAEKTIKTKAKCEKITKTDNVPGSYKYFEDKGTYTPQQMRQHAITDFPNLVVDRDQKSNLQYEHYNKFKRAMAQQKAYDDKREAAARLAANAPADSKSQISAGGGRKTRKKRGRGNEPTISSREWVVENTQASINRFVNSNLPERGDGFNNMIRRMTSGEMDGGFWIIEWSLTRPRDDNLNHFHLAHDDEDNEGPDLIRFVDGPDAPAGRRKRRKRKTKRKKRKKSKTKRKRKKRKKRKKKTKRRR